MKKITVYKQITTGTTGTPTVTSFINGWAYIDQIAYCCTNAGTGWVLEVKDRGNLGVPARPIKTLVVVPLTVPATPDQQKVFFDKSIPMIEGVDVVTSGTAAGNVNVWISANVTEEGV